MSVFSLSLPFYGNAQIGNGPSNTVNSPRSSVLSSDNCTVDGDFSTILNSEYSDIKGNNSTIIGGTSFSRIDCDNGTIIGSDNILSGSATGSVLIGNALVEDRSGFFHVGSSKPNLTVSMGQKRVGVNTSSPLEDFDVNGFARAKAFFLEDTRQGLTGQGFSWYGLTKPSGTLFNISGENPNQYNGAVTLGGYYGIALRTDKSNLYMPRNGEARFIGTGSSNTTFTLGNQWKASGPNEPTLKFGNGSVPQAPLGNTEDSEYFTLSASVAGNSYIRFMAKSWMNGANAGPKELMRINGQGKVIIGVNDQNKINQLSGRSIPNQVGINDLNNVKLYVGGGIRAEYIRVDLNTAWADYVFAKDYNLKPLSEVKTFVETHCHLPGVPTAEEVEKDGIDVAEMTKKQQEKIEEIYLYLFQLEKDMAALKEENRLLQKQLNDLGHD